MKPILIVIAGPNGSGKTTVTQRLRRSHWSEGVEYLNPDDVAQNVFGDWNSREAQLKAAQWTTERRRALLAHSTSFAFETVFSTVEKLGFLREAKDRGYFVRLFYIGTIDPEVNVARVAHRVSTGGHDVPSQKVRDRYASSMALLPEAMALVDRAYLYDNSIDGVDARLCARTEDRAVRKRYGRPPAWVDDALACLPRHAAFEQVGA